MLSLSMIKSQPESEIKRVFKTKHFTRLAKKAAIKDAELCEAISGVMKGQADNLGSGVFKKRLNKNRHRSIVIAKGGNYWVYVELYAKKDKANIADDELEGFKKLANAYAVLDGEMVTTALRLKELVEICQ